VSSEERKGGERRGEEEGWGEERRGREIGGKVHLPIKVHLSFKTCKSFVSTVDWKELLCK